MDGGSRTVRSSSQAPNTVFVLLALLGVLQARKFAATMPSVIATHFGTSGVPNGFQTLTQFFTLEIVMLVVCALLTFGIPRLIGSLPTSRINLQNKDYWLAPERREQTLSYFGTQFAWFGCALLAFLLVVNELVYQANLRAPHRLNGAQFVTVLIAFLVFVAIWTVRLILHFSKITKN
jgi:uncharacterized membrane protein